jgi:hypothetical protein
VDLGGGPPSPLARRDKCRGPRYFFLRRNFFLMRWKNALKFWITIGDIRRAQQRSSSVG